MEIPNISKPLKTKQVNIGSREQPKFEKIGDYWDEATIDKFTKLFHKYQDLFPTNFYDLKGIVEDLGVMKITLNPYVKPVNRHPYLLNLKYKKKVCKELDKMLDTGMIEPVEDSNWVSRMVVQEKK